MDAENLAQSFENFADGILHADDYSSAHPKPVSSIVLPDCPNQRWETKSKPQIQNEKSVLIKEIVDALPEFNVIQLLYETFTTRCQAATGNIIHTPSFMKKAESLHDCSGLTSREVRATTLASAFSMDELACCLLAVRMPVDMCMIAGSPSLP